MNLINEPDGARVFMYFFFFEKIVVKNIKC